MSAPNTPSGVKAFQFLTKSFELESSSVGAVLKDSACVGARASSSVGALLLLDEDSATKQHAMATAVDTVRTTSLHGGCLLDIAAVH